ncbi:MAG: DNA repair protein RadA [Syntrophaceae bacterium]|nr:DNA repair protein RadA [Syntrophaceae bacterium]
MKRQQKTAFFCQNCGYESPKWVGKCPGCGEWNRFAEEPVKSADSRLPPEFRFDGKPRPIDAVEADEKARVKTGIGEMDRVLGGGIVAGSAILVGGDPGIGKSTLLLQVMHRLASAGKKVLYVSGEESASQIRLRADRVGASSKSLYVLVEVSLENILTHIKEVAPDAIVIDSIQTVCSSMLTSAPGSVGQVREASERLIVLSKKTGIPVFLVGHVTKDGSIAGPKVLEHMVDTVLYFEGDSGHSYRIIRGIKNRFGPTNEIGVFEMRDRGLVEVSNPSEYFLTERPEGMAGSVVVAAIEGTRPILVEIQSLVASTSFGMPRRTAIGVDGNRLSLLVAVLDKIGGLHLGNHDIFVNVAGGVRLAEPAVDLGVVAAVASSFLDRPISPKTVVFGEMGLTGEIRGINQMEIRVREAARMGFKRCVLPRTQLRGLDRAASIELIRVGHLKDLLGEIF